MCNNCTHVIPVYYIAMMSVMFCLAKSRCFLYYFIVYIYVYICMYFLLFIVYFYCPFLWTHYKKISYSKIRVAFNNVFRRILKLPSRSSASTMYVVNNIDSLEVLVRKRIFGFMEQLNNSDNTIMKCITNSWILRFDIWSPWNDLLFIH